MALTLMVRHTFETDISFGSYASSSPKHTANIVVWVGGVTSYNDADEMCGYCDANRTYRPFTWIHLGDPVSECKMHFWMARVRRGHPLTDSKFFH